jgi:hypothetical protein
MGVSFEDLSRSRLAAAVEKTITIFGREVAMRAISAAEEHAIRLAHPEPGVPIVDGKPAFTDARFGAAVEVHRREIDLLCVGLSMGFEPSAAGLLADAARPVWTGSHIRAGMRASDTGSLLSSLGQRQAWCRATIEQLGAVLTDDQVARLRTMLGTLDLDCLEIGRGNSGGGEGTPTPPSAASTHD